ncbi:PREDICTED: formin-like protein 5 isoform X2 [Camelina sativa]|uniref:Formin-like protein 5 isoform X2 n=1 Tax=Camelina sativa TaxID=90675 RepID=A0ABM0VVI0_CAMSA|nr:PREDICTED: formin-like protein 5 isoform X2 [Camelina sativa]
MKLKEKKKKNPKNQKPHHLLSSLLCIFFLGFSLSKSMDPSLSVTNDPHHPPPFATSFPPFTNSNPYATPNNPFFAVAPPNNNHLFQAPPQQQQQLTSPVPTHPTLSHPPYSDMICTAISALNEPDGSSKQAIARYIERIYTGIPTTHGALLTHHLKTLKNSGILMMVKKSYKLAAAPPPTSVALAAAATGLEPPRSDFLVNENQPFPDPAMPSSTPPTQKRGRGRPPKPKPDVQAQPQTNGKPTWEQQTELPVSRPEEVQTQPPPQVQIQPQPPVKRPPGRPRKDGTPPTVKPAATVSGGVETVKRRGRPPSGRAAGRERKPAVVSAPASVFPYVANGGVRRRGRPKRVDAGASSSVAPPPPVSAGSGGEEVAVKKRGRGRPPKIGGVIRKPMKPLRRFPRSGRPVGRPKKNVVSMGASGRQDGDYGELKKKFELFQARAKDIVIVLKSEMGGSGNRSVIQAIQDLEGLTETETTNEPQHMETVQLPDEGHVQGQGQAQTEAEAMQEALF